jgi:hypothetical protein
MQADDFQAGMLGLPPHFSSLGRRNLVGIHGHRKRRDFDARVAAFGRESKRFLERPIAEDLVADGVLESRHGGVLGVGSSHGRWKKSRRGAETGGLGDVYQELTATRGGA